MRILTVVGARPQFIKSLPVSLALTEAGLEEIMVHTGQHFDHSMSGQFFQQLGLRQPHRNLRVGGGSHASQTAAMLVGLESCLQEYAPDALLVYGDTNSTLAAALAAAKLGIPIAHVEAGLRSGKLHMPEEVNRLVTDRVSRWLFTPTEAAQAHLIREGTHPANVFPVGDVMLDAFRRCAPLAPPVEQVIGLSAGEYVLATVHRPHHVDDPQVLHSLLDALTQLSQHIPVIFPVHPRTRQAMDGWSCPPGIRLLEPQGYLQILSLLRSCRVLVSDSGGLQKEAYFAGRRCVILNPGTEWVELVQLGWNLLLPEHSGLVQTVLNMSPQPPAVDGALYGGGQASRRIAHILSGQPDWSQLDAPALQRA